jgi:hypothetical protein
MSNARLGHDRYRDRGLDFFDHRWIGYASDSAVAADIGRDAFEGQNGVSARFFGDASLWEDVGKCEIPVWQAEATTCSALTTSMTTRPFSI